MVDARQQQRELVAAQPRDGVPFAHALAEPLRDAAQQLVARGVAEAVVDLLEAIEVDEDEPHALAVAVSLRERDLEAVLEEPPVREPGERVPVSEGVEALLERARLGHVAQRQRQVAVAERRHARLEQHVDAVVAEHGHVARPALPGASPRDGVALEPLGLGGVEALAPRAPDEIDVGRPRQEPRAGFVDERDEAGLVQHDEPVRHGLQQAQRLGQRQPGRERPVVAAHRGPLSRRSGTSSAPAARRPRRGGGRSASGRPP